MPHKYCDRTGQVHEELEKQIDWTQLGLPANPSIFDFTENQQWNITGNAARNSYSGSTNFLSPKNGLNCADNWGFSNKEEPPVDFVSNFGISEDKGCPLKLQSKYGLNMYKFLVTDDALQHDALKGKRVLEVGSGRGRGAAYVAKTFEPASYLGVELSADRVEQASNSFAKISNLKFTVGNALQLPIQNSSMDFVLNVESSFHYPDFEQFLSEVYRVLQPGGTFLWTAPLLNRGDSIAHKEAQFTKTHFRLEKIMDITENVMESRRGLLEKCDEEEWAILCASLYDGSFLWPWFALPGTKSYEAMKTKILPYVRIVATKSL
jgi:ubiquinone/menaquinone biosynthesis C-methylase UbiE